MSAARFDSLEFSPDAIGWREPTDSDALCQKLLALSVPNAPEPTLGLSLFIRAYLPYVKARPGEAAVELLDLTYCGENRAFLASLSGNLPQEEMREKAAELCVERLTATPGLPESRWATALVEMRPDTAEGYLCFLAASDEPEVVLATLCAMEGRLMAPPQPLWARLAQLSRSDDWRICQPASLLMLLARPGDAAETMPEIVRHFADELIDRHTGTASLREYLAAAALLNTEDDSLCHKCRDMLLAAVSAEPDEVAAAAFQAVAIFGSPMIDEWLSRLCAEGLLGKMQVVALALQRLPARDDASKWLEAVLSRLPDPSGPGVAWLGSALGYSSCTARAWEYALFADGRGYEPFAFAEALACGGDPDAIVGLLRMAKEVSQHVASSPSDANTEPVRSWEQLRLGLTAALAIWSRQSAEVAPLRWEAMLELLRPRHDKPDDMAFLCAQQVLLGMAQLCIAGHLPRPYASSVTARTRTWLETQLPLETEPSALEQLYEAPCYWAQTRAVGVTSYQSQNALFAAMHGKESPLDDDQREAQARFKERLKEAFALTEQYRPGGAIPIWQQLISDYPRVPIRGAKRLEMLAEIEYHLAVCYSMIADNEETDHDESARLFKGLFHSPSVLDEARRLTIEHGTRALSLAERIGHDDLSRRASDITGVVSEQ